MAKYALCIGINDYPGTHMDLSGCVNDAKDWAKVFTQRGFTVEMLLNKEAKGKAIRQRIQSLLKKAKSGDFVVIQFSGHGSFVPDEDSDEPDGTDECICPYDVMRKGPITDDELFELYSQRGHGVRLLMISDSCHSGTVARFAPITTPPTITGENPPQRKVRFLPPATFLPKKQTKKLGLRRAIRASSPPGRYAALLLAGCQDTEYSYDGFFAGRPNGVFTFVAIQTLKKLSPNVTYEKWIKEIRKVLPSQQYPQTPNLYGSKKMRKWKILE